MNKSILSKFHESEKTLQRKDPSWVDLPRDITVKRYGSHDVQVLVSSPPGVPGKSLQHGRAKRGNIQGFSRSSRRRMKLIFGAFKNIDSLLHEMTLTYPSEYPKDGLKVKRDLKVMSQRLKRNGIEIAGWKQEYQERGAAHYHAIVYLDGELTNEIKQFISKAWFEVVGSNDGKHLRAGTRISKINSRDHLLCYLNKYIEKEKQSKPPSDFINPGRVWGYNKKFVDVLIERAFITSREFGIQTRLIRRMWKNQIKRWYGLKWKWYGTGFTIFEFSNFMPKLGAMFP